MNNVVQLSTSNYEARNVYFKTEFLSRYWPSKWGRFRLVYVYMLVQ